MKTEVKTKKPEIEFIAIVCCTCCRPNIFTIALNKIKTLKLPKNVRVELLIIDNDKEASAQSVIEIFSDIFPVKINYFIEERRGIAIARNRLLKEALNLGATHIAMLDDDGFVDQNWLMNHIECYKKYSDAYVISGPQYTWFNGKFPDYITQNNVFKTSTSKVKGQELKSCATNNVFLPTEIIRKDDIWFDESYIFMGGEDGDFFKRVREHGYQIVFNSDSVVEEITDEHRANLKWMISRCYYNGYSGATLKFKTDNSLIKRLLYLAKNIIVLVLDIIATPFSILRGLTTFFNTVCMTAKTAGKIMGCIKNRPINYYEKVVGT